MSTTCNYLKSVLQSDLVTEINYALYASVSGVKGMILEEINICWYNLNKIDRTINWIPVS